MFQNGSAYDSSEGHVGSSSNFYSCNSASYDDEDEDDSIDESSVDFVDRSYTSLIETTTSGDDDDDDDPQLMTCDSIPLGGYSPQKTKKKVSVPFKAHLFDQNNILDEDEPTTVFHDSIRCDGGNIGPSLGDFIGRNSLTKTESFNDDISVGNSQMIPVPLGGYSPKRPPSPTREVCRKSSLLSAEERSLLQEQLGYGIQKEVDFSFIQVHYHGYDLGDSPSVNDGPPLTIEWERQEVRHFQIDTYEAKRPSEERRQRNDFRITALDRAKLLFASGYSIEDIVKCASEAERAKKALHVKLHKEKWDKFHMAIEKTNNGIHKVGKGGKKIAKGTVKGGAKMAKVGAKIVTAPIRIPMKRIMRRTTMSHVGENKEIPAPPAPRKERRRSSLYGNFPIQKTSERILTTSETTHETVLSSESERQYCKEQTIDMPHKSRRRGSFFGGGNIQHDSSSLTAHQKTHRRGSFFGGGGGAAGNAAPESIHAQQKTHRRGSFFGAGSGAPPDKAGRRGSFFGGSRNEEQSLHAPNKTRRRGSLFGGGGGGGSHPDAYEQPPSSPDSTIDSTVSGQQPQQRLGSCRRGSLDSRLTDKSSEMLLPSIVSPTGTDRRRRNSIASTVATKETAEASSLESISECLEDGRRLNLPTVKKSTLPKVYRLNHAGIIE